MFNPKSFRNSFISKIHIAKKELAMEDADYRALLERVTGETSSTKLDNTQLGEVLDELKKLGFKAKPGKGIKPSAPSDNPQARKIRALWITLHKMGEVREGTEDGLLAFVQKTSGIDSLQWIDGKEADLVINALKGWIRRAGGDPNDF